MIDIKISMGSGSRIMTRQRSSFISLLRRLLVDYGQ